MSSVPIQTIHLFPMLDRKLLDLLRSLTIDEWMKPTRAKLWNVKDIASHLLDGNIRTLSISRDKFFGEKAEAIHDYQDLVNFLNQLNADWVKATKRISPETLISLLEITGTAFYEHIKSLDPFSTAVHPVSWAGEEESKTWFHIAREYTEKWHHQQQIREAVNKPGIMSRDLYFPVLDTFIRALPYTYRHVSAQPGTCIQITVSGEAGGSWFLQRTESSWQLHVQPDKVPNAIVSMDEDIAWKLFTKGLSRVEAEVALHIDGERSLGESVARAVAVMA